LAVILNLPKGVAALFFKLLDGSMIHAEAEANDHGVSPPKYNHSSAFIVQILRVIFNII